MSAGFTAATGLSVGPEHKGVAVIIGNSYTRQGVVPIKRTLHPLDGSHKDAEMMKESFEYLKFCVVVMHNVTQDELMALLYSLADRPYPKSCQRFVFAFSGHGGDGFICSEDEKSMAINDIIGVLAPKSSNDPLLGIPRLFFFDTCRGDEFDIGIILSRGGDENWKSRIPSTGDVLVAYATSSGYKAFEGIKGGLWTSILAKKLVTSPKSVYDILTEVNKELIEKMRTISQTIHAPRFQQPELLGRLNDIIELLNESGQPPKVVAQSTDESSFLPRPPLGQEFLKSPKSSLNEFCQLKKFSLPKYESLPSENGFVIVAVTIEIERQQVRYTYSSEQALLTKKYSKECEEKVAEIALTELSKLYGTSVPRSPERTQSVDEPVYHSRIEMQRIPSCPGFGPPMGSPKKAKSQLNEMFQKYSVSDVKYDARDDVSSYNVHYFKVTLSYTLHGICYRYDSRGMFSRKQDAEEDAAQQALHEIGQQQFSQHVSRGGASANQYKSLLKERYCDARKLQAPQYTTDSSGGGFVSTVSVPQYQSVRGPLANSKKEAEQFAAKEALRRLKLI